MTPIKISQQKSRYAVPAAVAVAAHAIFFLGFAPPTPKTVPPEAPKLSPPRNPDPILIDLAQPDPYADTQGERTARQISAAPTLPEFLPDLITKTDFTMPVVAAPTGPVDPDLRVSPGERPQFGGLHGFPGGPATLRMIDLDNVPRVTFQARPDYPFTLRSQGISGEVMVNFLVDEQGRVSDVRVIRSTHPEFEPATLRAVSRWRFESGKRNGQAVRFRMSQAVSFAIGN